MVNNHKERTLILVHSKYPWVEYANQNGYHVDQVFRNVNLLKRVLRKFCMKNHITVSMESWLNDWYHSIDRYETIIIFASALFKPLFYWIRKKNPAIRLICWYWDPFSDCKLRFKPDEGIERWSFDDDDCKLHQMAYSKTFFTPRPIQKNPENQEMLFDVFFVGEDKGRYEKLMRLRDYLNGLGLKTSFTIVRDHKLFVENRGFKRRHYDQPIPEEEAAKYIQQSRILVDLYQRGQTGLSQRAVEALLNKKKLITDNENIKKYDFYRENNIFVLNDNNLNEIEEFLKKPYEEISGDILKQYSFDSWFERFFND